MPQEKAAYSVWAAWSGEDSWDTRFTTVKESQQEFQEKNVGGLASGGSAQEGPQGSLVGQEPPELSIPWKTNSQ